MGKLKKKAIGIVRVSAVGGRSDGRFHSPEDQRDLIRALAEREKWKLTFAQEELNVSGDSLLEDRPGLSQAVIAVQTGAADIIVAAHTERLFWNAETRAQVLRLVEAAGGEVWSADVGHITDDDPVEELNGGIRMSVDRFSRRQNAKKSRAAVKRAVAKGVLPHPKIPPGYERGEDGVLVPHPEQAPVVAEAFRLRSEGATLTLIRDYLAENGIERLHPAVGNMLASRTYLGEIHFGELVNTDAHPAIVDEHVWKAVQRVRVPRGRKPRTERLLARLGVLRCAGCGGLMVGGTQTRRGRPEYPFYRCPPERHRRDDPRACKARSTIASHIVEKVVVDAVLDFLGDMELQATVESNRTQALDKLNRTQDALNSAIRKLTGLEEEAAAKERLAELREDRDRAQERVDQLGPDPGSPITWIKPGTDWDSLDLAAKRMLIAAAVVSVDVHKGGRGAERITLRLNGDD